MLLRRIKPRTISPNRVRKMALKAELVQRARRMGLTDCSFSCNTRALHIWITEEERRRATNLER